MTTLRRVTLIALAGLLALPAAGSAQNRHSDSMSFVKNLPYEVREDYGMSTSYGTDVEFAKIRNRQYAFAGSEINGLQVVDITNPRKAYIRTVYECAISQGDTQVFTRGRSTYVTYTNDYEDNARAAGSRCYRETRRRFASVDEDGNAKLGTFILDVSKPQKPKAVSFVEFPRGSHNMTVHPSGEYLYNSNSDLTGFGWPPAIEVVDITRIEKPKMLESVPLTPFPGLGADSHDITFNEDGTRAYSAALSHGVILDTSDAANPSVITEFTDPAINVWHQADPVTIGDREFLIVEDEVAGAAGPGVCPTGGVHIFDITDETLPVKVGYWNIDDPALRDPLDTCTAHVLDVHEDEQIMTIAYYMGGVRVVDLSGLADMPLGVGQGETAVGGGLREIGHYVMSDANAWSAKTPFIEPDGDFYLYADDINRGLDVFRFDAQAAPSSNPGTFMTASVAERKLGGLDLSSLTKRQRDQQVFCLLKGARRTAQR